MNKDQEFMNLVKSILLDDDLRLLKAFPMFVDYKRDIVYTPEIVDYFIDNYLFLKEEYIFKIPLESFSDEQYIRMMYKAFSNERSSFHIPHFYKMCEKNFNVSIRAFESKFVCVLPSDITTSQMKKVRSIALKKLRNKNFINRVPSLPDIVICNISKFFIDRPNIIDRVSAKNYIELTTRTSYIQDVKELIYQVYDVILDKFPDMIIEVAESFHRTTMEHYIQKHYIPNKGQEQLVDEVVKHWNITKEKFKKVKIKHDYSWESSGIRLLVYLLRENGIITTAVFGNRITYYRDGFMSYHIMKIYKILTDVNNMQSYINNVYKRGDYIEP